MAAIHSALIGASGPSNFLFTISTNQTNANLRTLAVNAGWDQNTKVIATIDSGIYVSSDSTGTAGLTVNGSFPGGVELINNGFIVGMGGAGGGGGGSVSNPPYTNTGQAGFAGGLALSVSTAISITNNNTVAGGGGGGGGGGSGSSGAAGGGGGGGRTGSTNSAGGIRGIWSGNAASAGSAGTSAGPGGGGAGGSAGATKDGTYSAGGGGGTGGGWGASGSSGAAGSPGYSAGGGGAAGAAVTGNSNITWVTTGTRLGAIS